MTRLISGVAGGRRLKVPRTGRPAHRRPRPRGALQLPESLLDLRGAAVLDLYAGSGALGLEALSRGAATRGLRRVRRRRAARPQGNLAAVGLPGGRVVAGSVPTVVGGAPPARSTWCSPTRPTRPRSRRCWACSARWSTAAGWHPSAVVVWSAPAGRSPGSGRHPWSVCATGATARPSSGTVAPREACRLPRILRPGHQRSRRRHHPGRRPLRRARRGGAGQPRQGRAVLRRRAHGPAARGRRRPAQRHRRQLRGPAGRLLPRPRHPGDRQGPARGQRLRVRAPDGADEPRAGRHRDAVRARPPRRSATCRPAWSSRSPCSAATSPGWCPRRSTTGCSSARAGRAARS